MRNTQNAAKRTQAPVRSSGASGSNRTAAATGGKAASTVRRFGKSAPNVGGKGGGGGSMAARDKADKAYDKAHGIKQGSKKDIALDKKRGVYDYEYGKGKKK